ncbi:hypothetical protein WME77_02145 [Sorangium sp. So ce764]|uniref:hypothetical protein n=1 Tax=Sorangium sp. So ce764 TaxID=3133320 RepID=UPI003F5E180D
MARQSLLVILGHEWAQDDSTVETVEDPPPVHCSTPRAFHSLDAKPGKYTIVMGGPVLDQDLPGFKRAQAPLLREPLEDALGILKVPLDHCIDVLP